MPRNRKRPLSGASSSNKRRRLSPPSTDAPRCPILDHRDHLLATISECELTVVIGSPGQGKSSQLPRMLLETGLVGAGSVAVVHVSAASASAAADQLSGPLGAAVGLETRFESRGRPDHVRLRFITDGCFLRKLLEGGVLERHSLVLLDDVHLRCWQTDLLMLFLRMFVDRRKQQRKTVPKLILMGSLMDSSDLLAFFPMLKSRVVFLSSSNSPGHELKCKDLVTEVVVNHMFTAVRAVVLLHRSYRRGDILCFLASKFEVMYACFLARSLFPDAVSASSNSLRPIVMSLYKGMPRKEMEKVVAAAPEGHRKVIFSDSFAENSMKIYGVSIVVDSGFCQVKEYFDFSSIPALGSQLISAPQAFYREQRARAVGRGVLYRLYTHEDPTANGPMFLSPELERVSLASALLFSLKLKFNINSFPSRSLLPEQFDAAYNELKLLGAITEHDGQVKVTPIGELLVRLPLDVPLARSLVAASELGCSAELLTIAAMLNAGPIFHDFGGTIDRIKRARRRFATVHGDCVSLLLIYRAYRSAVARGEKSFCRRHCLNSTSLRLAFRFRKRLRLRCRRLGLAVRSCGTDFRRVNTALTTGYLLGVVQHLDDVVNGTIAHNYTTASGRLLSLSCDSALFAANAPQLLVHLESENCCGWEISIACPADKELVRRLQPRLLGLRTDAPEQVAHEQGH